MTTKDHMIQSEGTTYETCKNRIETLKNMGKRYGRILVQDVQLVCGKPDEKVVQFYAVTHGWKSTRFWFPIRKKDGWHICMPDPKKL